MTNPLGKHWPQPRREDIEFTVEGVSMSKKSFDKLHDYSASTPSGVYPGKMWKSRVKDGWVLRYYSEIENNSCRILFRPITICP